MSHTVHERSYGRELSEEGVGLLIVAESQRQRDNGCGRGRTREAIKEGAGRGFRRREGWGMLVDVPDDGEFWARRGWR